MTTVRRALQRSAMAVIVAAVKRWSWAFFAIGVLLALYATARLYNLVQATRRPDPDRRMCGLLGIARIGYRTECTVAAARPPRNGGKGGIVRVNEQMTAPRHLWPAARLRGRGLEAAAKAWIRRLKKQG